MHLLVRDEAKGAGVADRIRAAHPAAELRLWRCDVADLDDVRRFATGFAAEVPDLHAVVHNAGVMPPERTESPQGLELSMAVHLVGPVVMTEALRRPLAGGRVVLVSSGGMYGQPLHADDPGFTAGDYSPTTSYARSKRWQVELAPMLADRWGADGTTVATMHPGWADTPGVRESLPTLPLGSPGRCCATTRRVPTRACGWRRSSPPRRPVASGTTGSSARPTCCRRRAGASRDRARAAWLQEAAGLDDAAAP